MSKKKQTVKLSELTWEMVDKAINKKSPKYMSKRKQNKTVKLSELTWEMVDEAINKKYPKDNRIALCRHEYEFTYASLKSKFLDNKLYLITQKELVFLNDIFENFENDYKRNFQWT